MKSHLLFLQALTPLHAGTGQGTGLIDLPIARERATNWPYLPGSSLKGTLRAGSAFDEREKTRVFGSPDGQGALQFADARLAIFPARSLRGTLCYASSPLVLSRLARDAKMCGVEVPPISENQGALVTPSSVLVGNGEKLVLEDLDVVAQKSETAQGWAKFFAERVFDESERVFDESERAAFEKRFVILPQNVFDFLVETATEIVARVKLEDDTKTVQPGGLWYEELLPTESVLCAIVTATGAQLNADLNALKAIESAQFGGKTGVGRGLCRVRGAF